MLDVVFQLGDSRQYGLNIIYNFVLSFVNVTELYFNM